MARESSRAARQARRGTGFRQLPWRPVTNPLPPIEPLTAEQIEAIHDASLQVLEEIGMDFLHPEARAILGKGGATVDGDSQRVRFDREMVTELIAGVPASFRLHARNPSHDLVMGGNNINFAMVGSPPSAIDLDRGKRTGNFEDYCNLVRLAQAFNTIHLNGGYPVEPIDLAPGTRHLDCLAAFVTLTDKVFHAYSLGRQRMVDGLEIVRIARGVTREQLSQEPSVISVVNTSSPLRLDGPMIEGLIEMAKLGQPVVVTPFTLSGAMAPATIVGALTQQNAEALATIALIQMVRPGAPAMYGGFTSNVDMRSGAPAFGTPEYTTAALAGGQLARRYGIPYRSSNATASNAPDAQAAYEAQMSLWGAVMGHASLVMHGAGWLDGGLLASFEKVVIDVEMLQMLSEFLLPTTVDDGALGIDAMREVGPGGHFFGAAHTLARYEDAFYAPLVSDWTNYEAWEEAGAETTDARANRIWKQALEHYEQPPLGDGRAAELEEFVAKRKAEGGVGE